MRFNTAVLRAPVMPEDSREFSDPSNPGVVLPLRLVALGTVGQSMARERAAEYIEEYVYPPQGQEKKPVPAIENAEGGLTFIEPTAHLCNAVALLEAMQPEEERLTFLEWLHVAVAMPSAWIEIQGFSGALLGRAVAALGNAAGVATSTPADSHSVSGQATRP